tara:strand:+ start:654 stop:1244 length:591 start_codon:yes stop_codon:yes gene_type:complete
MPITLNGSGTVSGISAGGLPDGIIQSADIASGVIPAGGKILQVVQTVKTDHFSASNANGSDITGMSVTITPASSSNKVLILCELAVGDAGNGYAGFILRRGSTNIGNSTALDGQNAANTQDTAFGFGSESSQATYKLNNTSFQFLDSPSTTSATTYKLQLVTWTSGTFHLNRPNSLGNARYTMAGTSTITAQEVAA